MKFPNPNLLRFIRPTRLQLWCAHRGVLTGRWTYAETERIRRDAADRYHRFREGLSEEDREFADRLNGPDPYDTAEFSCPHDDTPLIAPWQKCPKCGRSD